MSETSENINVNDQRYKLSILKKAVIEERAKTEKITAELNKYKEELIIKQEQIDKLKEELMKIKDGSSKKQIKRFFNDLFEEGEEEQQKMIMNNTILQIENEELKKKIKSLENEKSFISTKLNDSLSDYKNMKEMYEVQVEEMEKSYKAKIGHTNKANTAPKRFLKEIRGVNVEEYTLGQVIDAIFSSEASLLEFLRH